MRTSSASLAITPCSNRIPDSRVVVLEGAGHLLNIERADEFNALVRDFLA